jgi:hypothetical protein
MTLGRDLRRSPLAFRAQFLPTNDGHKQSTGVAAPARDHNASRAANSNLQLRCGFRAITSERRFMARRLAATSFS